MTSEKFGQPPEAEALIKKRMSSLRTMWAVVFIYFLYRVYNLPAAMQSSPKTLNTEEVSLMIRVFTGVSFFVLFLSWMVPRFLLKRAEKRKTSLFKATVQGFVARLGFLLSMGWFGYILALSSKNLQQGLPMVAACVIGLLLNFPTTRKFNREASELLQTRNQSNP